MTDLDSRDPIFIGPWFQLAMELGATDAGRLRAAIDGALAHPHLVPGTRYEPAAGEIRWTVGVEVAEHTLRGLLDGFFDGQADWLTLNVPIGEVGTAFRVRFPEPPPTEEEMRLGVDASRVELHVDMNPWMRRMEAGFVDMADSVAAVVPFELALIGEEVSGNWSAIGDERVPSLTRERVDRHGGVLLGPATRQRLSPARMGVTLSSGLRWYPS